MMIDLADTLSAARKNSDNLLFGRNGGNTRNTADNHHELSGLAVSHHVPTLGDQAGAVGTVPNIVPSVPTSNGTLGTRVGRSKAEWSEALRNNVPSVPSVPSENEYCRENWVELSDPTRCHACGERFGSDSAVVAVLTDTAGQHHWLHHGACHDDHVDRCATARAHPDIAEARR